MPVLDTVVTLLALLVLDLGFHYIQGEEVGVVEQLSPPIWHLYPLNVSALSSP